MYEVEVKIGLHTPPVRESRWVPAWTQIVAGAKWWWPRVLGIRIHNASGAGRPVARPPDISASILARSHVSLAQTNTHEDSAFHPLRQRRPLPPHLHRPNDCRRRNHRGAGNHSRARS